MSEYPESDQKTELQRHNEAFRPAETPGRLAWKVCRYLARFVGSVFFPYFRVWGETDLTPGGQIFIARDFGILTWITALRVFKRPMRLVFLSEKHNQRWFNLATSSGLAPLRLPGSIDQNFLTLEHMADAGEKLLVVIPRSADSSIEELIRRLRATRSLRVLFMAVSGAAEALPESAVVPRAVPVSVFCGLPHYAANVADSAFAELDFLENAIKDLEVDELPSIFFNHRRNLSKTTSA